MRKKIMHYVLLLAVLSFVNCGKKGEIKNINLSEPAVEVEVSKNAIRVGIAAVISPKEGFLHHKELLDYIGEKMSQLFHYAPE